MKVTHAMAEMPYSASTTTEQAAQVLALATPELPVLVVDLEGRHRGAIKSAFVRAAKLHRQNVSFQDDDGRLLVKVSAKKHGRGPKA